MTKLIGLDVGTSSLKGLVINESGAVIGEAERSYAFDTPRPGWAEQDPELWWQAAEAVLDELGAGDADGIGLSGQMHGLVALGADDRPLRPAILWNDGRAQRESELIEQRIGVERLIELSGNRALVGFTAPKLLWLAEHEPEVHRQIRRVLLPKDYVRLRLFVDPTAPGGYSPEGYCGLARTVAMAQRVERRFPGLRRARSRNRCRSRARSDRASGPGSVGGRSR